MSKASYNLAAIDIGTNSFHLVVAEVNRSTGRFKILDREKEIIRLGSGSTDMKYLSEAAMNRGIDALKRYKMIADANNAYIRAIATSAVREALNQDVFVHRVKEEVTIDVEVASGVEEARLIYLGVLQALAVFHKTILLIDIGGGSTEFLVGKSRKILLDNSLKLGAIRLTERFFRNGTYDGSSIKKCRKYISGTLAPVIREIKKQKFEVIVGTSGTIQNIARIIHSAHEDESPEDLNNVTFTRDQLSKITALLLKTKDQKQRVAVKGLDPSRADIIVAGALILDQVFTELKIKRMVVSEYALREGIIYDTIEKRSNNKRYNHLVDLRYNSVLHLAETLGYEQYHSHQVAALSLRIFDQLKKLHGLGNAEREFLEAAAILHEVGFFLSHAQHHRHSYYLIRNAELLGFTENEKELIANVARYHRKSHPKYKHEAFRRLNNEEQQIVNKLSAILRIADGLDRTHASLIADVVCRISPNSVRMLLKKTNSSPIDLELWGAERKKGLFEETYSRKVFLKQY